MNALFKALNDPTRREILELLKKSTPPPGSHPPPLHTHKPTNPHHLDLLKQAGLVQAMKEGQFIYYSLNTTVMDEIVKWFVGFKSKK